MAEKHCYDVVTVTGANWSAARWDDAANRVVVLTLPWTAKSFEPPPPTPGLREFVTEQFVGCDERFVVDDTPPGVNPLTPDDGDRRGGRP